MVFFNDWLFNASDPLNVYNLISLFIVSTKKNISCELSMYEYSFI